MIGRGVAAVLGSLLAVVVFVTAAGAAAVTTTAPLGAGSPSAAAVGDIPAAQLALYRAAARTCPGLDWAVLAAVGKVESDHGRSRLPGVRAGANSAGARGPMQFLPATFAAVTAAHPPPPGGARPPSPYNASDAIHAAAAYLCDNGARHARDLRRAIFTYNHSTAYVAAVLRHADRYRATATPLGNDGPRPGTGAAGDPGRAVVAFARAQLGLPYLWGGDGPTAGEVGFDCSGLSTAAYRAAGIRLPRTAHTQYLAGPLLPPGTPLQAGDLLFFGTPARVHHVGVATGEATLMIHAPRRGMTIRVQDARGLPDLLAASRPRR